MRGPGELHIFIAKKGQVAITMVLPDGEELDLEFPKKQARRMGRRMFLLSFLTFRVPKT